MAKARISILDGFRALAILSVLLFHFFSRWAPPRSKVSMYPYNNAYDYFGYGKLGVEFFFIISGFVIFFTLDKTDYFGSFWKKRFIRLLPSIIVASLITFLVFVLFDHQQVFPESHHPANFIPSISFISPTLLNSVFSQFNPQLGYLNGSYWSLWPEIQFYLFASVIYFSNKAKFLERFLAISIALICLNFVAKKMIASQLIHIPVSASFVANYSKWFFFGFNLGEYLHLFCLGMIFYLLFKNRQQQQKLSIFVKCCFGFLLLFTMYAGMKWDVRLIYALMIALFFLFVYAPGKLRLFENKTLTTIGQSSYFLYLIHENIGVFIIYSIGQYFLPAGFVLPLLLIVGFVVLSNLYTAKVESRINNWLKAKPAKPKPVVVQQA